MSLWTLLAGTGTAAGTAAAGTAGASTAGAAKMQAIGKIAPNLSNQSNQGALSQASQEPASIGLPPQKSQQIPRAINFYNRK